tara:strand:- start:30 stop:269 length:240 start_codon:yes stop_codon:yes gene_type:complete
MPQVRPAITAIMAISRELIGAQGRSKKGIYSTQFFGTELNVSPSTSVALKKRSITFSESATPIVLVCCNFERVMRAVIE